MRNTRKEKKEEEIDYRGKGKGGTIHKRREWGGAFFLKNRIKQDKGREILKQKWESTPNIITEEADKKK